MSRYMVFDVESIGLHGEAFAVGWVVVNGDRASDDDELDYGFAACSPDVARGADSDRAWVMANCPPLPIDCSTPAEVRAAFWSAWMRERANGAVLVADCAWPVEARFLAACVDVDPEARRWAGPYPLHDVATARLAAGLDPLTTTERRPNELPAHHPTCDARQSARLFLDALGDGRRRVRRALRGPPRRRRRSGARRDREVRVTSPFDHTLDKAALARAAEEYRRNLAAQAKQFSPPLTTMPPMYGATAASSLTEADVRRIVWEEMEATNPPPSVLDVTPEDVRAWLPGGLCR